MTTVEPALAERFAQEGFPHVEAIGRGMEGVVYRLAPGTVAKAWFHTSAERVRMLQAFYGGIVSAGLAIRTPEIVAVWQVGERTVSVEKELTGRTLESCEPLRPDRLPATAAALVGVLEQFAAVPQLDALRALPVLDETVPFALPGQTWPEALGALVTRRVNRSAPLLRAAVADLDNKVSAVLDRLASMGSGQPGLVHGDLITANVLVDTNNPPSPTAVLDFGFLSVHGDVAFDAAVTASIAEMYGPTAREVEGALDAAFVRAFGLDAERLAVYRAAYALITSTAYDATGADGHFAWCVAMLTRADVCGALGVGVGRL